MYLAAPVAPGDGEVFARAVNDSYVEVTVSLNGCNIHDELEDHDICVSLLQYLLYMYNCTL